jgi:hypothetical protein
VVAVRPLGVAGVVSLLVAGQLAISVLSDRLGWFGVAQVGFTPGACGRCAAGRGRHAADHATLTTVDRRSPFRIATDADRADRAV